MRSASERLLHGVLNSCDALPLGTDGDIVAEVSLRNHVHATEFDDHPNGPQRPGALHERVKGGSACADTVNVIRISTQNSQRRRLISSSGESHVLLLTVAADLDLQLLLLPVANRPNSSFVPLGSVGLSLTY
jgi:hypothetical protein